MLYRTTVLSAAAFMALGGPVFASDGGRFEELVRRHASAQGIPEALIHRVIRAESNYNARASHAGNLGLMQIRYGTARGMGYGGAASGLLDAETNLAFGVPYLAQAYRVAGGNQDRAIRLYRSGFYYQAKRRGMLGTIAAVPVQPAIQAAPASSGPASLLASLFGSPSPAATPVATETVVTTGSVPEPRRHRWHRHRYYR